MRVPGKYIRRAKTLGARDAKLISAKTIVTAPWVRLKCRFGCDGYAGCLTCPPNSPTPEETRSVLGCYRHALLVHGDGKTAISEIIPVLEREIFLDGNFKAFGMGAGPCTLCPECAPSCRHPEQARPAMEACGIDVFSTARANGFPIQVLKGSACGGNYYGIVLID